MREAAMSDEMEGRALMLYDGLCGVCNSAVQWVIKRDHGDRFRFAPQQSAVAAAILSRNGIDHEAMLDNNSVYLVLNAGTKQERLLTQSDVTVSMLTILGGRWRVLGKLLGAVPLFVRNFVYRMFARNRYRLTGQYEVCPIPSEAQQIKFVG
jgi:predicted DCC family thiol-disulfide oxidoreductase YuxK